MVDEPNEAIKIGVVVHFSAGMVGVTLVFLFILLGILIGINNKVADLGTASGKSAILELQNKSSVPAPTVYSAVETTIGSIDTITFVPTSGGAITLYKYDDINCQNTIWLLTKYTNYEVKCTITDSTESPSLFNMRLEVVE